MYSDRKWPIVYSNHYNVRFFGIEKLHPFDACKWGHIYHRLQKLIHIGDKSIYVPAECSEEELLTVHTRRYLNSLKWSWNVAKIAEVPVLACVPNVLCQRCYLRPMRYQTRGTVMGAELAVDRGWAINLGGGFHHCSKDMGEGFCPYADITLAIESVFKSRPHVKQVMILDLDAHQGNGHERDFMNNHMVYIMDMYNSSIFPGDEYAKKAISCKIELENYTPDGQYLDKLENGLERSLNSFHPDLIVYNAGTDIMDGDPLGKLSVSPLGVIRRDELVFTKARERNIPIVMLSSGGYTRQSAAVVANSIANLHNLEIITRHQYEE